MRNKLAEREGGRYISEQRLYRLKAYERQNFSEFSVTDDCEYFVDRSRQSRFSKPKAKALFVGVLLLKCPSRSRGQLPSGWVLEIRICATQAPTDCGPTK
jgi:hypothetical protein